MKQTANGALAYEHSMNHCLEFFSKAGATNSKGLPYYQNQTSGLELFKASWYADHETSMKLLLWLRDCRGGAGNRGTARECIEWLADIAPDWLLVNLDLIPKYGRWDDLKVLFGTELEKPAANLWASALSNRDVLAAKWADRNMLPLRKALNMKVGPFRRFLASIRKDHIVEHKMCSDDWESIQYEHVPSVCMSRFSKIFRIHDKERFQEYLEQVKSGTKTIHSDVLFPHNCVMSARLGENDVADAQFDALPNFLEQSNDRILVIADTSGSMTQSAFGNIQCVDISQGMALYCSAKIPEESPFYKRFIDFGNEAEFKDWRGHSFSEAVNNPKLFTEAVADTRVDRALDLILDTATSRNIPQDLMPTVLMIVSDMQFNCATENSDDTVIEYCLKKWDNAGYDRPRILYWNTNSYAHTQATESMENVGMISGFSPAILKAVFAGEEFTPVSIMNRTLEGYEVKKPDKFYKKM